MFCVGFRRAATLLTARQGMMSARGDFLNYALSLMRSHNDEHSDVLPVLDVCSLKHVAYVFQALIYWIKAMNQQTTLDTPQMDRKRWFENVQNCLIVLVHVKSNFSSLTTVFAAGTYLLNSAGFSLVEIERSSILVWTTKILNTRTMRTLTRV